MDRNDYHQSRDIEPVLGRVVKPATLTGGPKVYLINPARIVNPEVEGADLQTEVDTAVTMPVHFITTQGPANGDYIIGIPLGPKLIAVRKVDKPVCGQIVVAVQKCILGVTSIGGPVEVSRDGELVAVGAMATIVSNVTITNRGAGHKGPFTVTFGPAAGGAFGTASVIGGQIQAVTMVWGGSGVTGAVSPDFGAGGGTGGAGSVQTVISYAFPVTEPGSYTVSAPPPAGPWWSRTPPTAEVNATCATKTVSLSYLPSVGYGCRGNCSDPTPDRLLVTDDFGSATLAWYGPSAAWMGYYVHPDGRYVNYSLRPPSNANPIAYVRFYSLTQHVGAGAPDASPVAAWQGYTAVESGTGSAPDLCPWQEGSMRAFRKPDTWVVQTDAYVSQLT